MPKVSVIIPAHNAEKHIEDCLLSLKGQTFKDFEVIVVNDGSKDKTQEIASKYARVIKSDDNLGEGAARNLGAQESKGQVLVFTDADVVVTEDWLAKIIKNMEIHSLKCVGGGYRGSLSNSFMEKFAYLELAYRRKDIPKFVNTIVANNFACDRDVFFEFAGFPERFKCEDLRLSFKISRKYPIFWDKDNGVFHYFRPSLRAYLRQQYFFARDTVWAYCSEPEMFWKHTHQGKEVYLETIFMFFALIGLILFPGTALIFWVLILILNYNFLLFLKRANLSIARSLLLILSRDIVLVIGIISGLGLCLKDILSRLFKRIRLLQQ